MKGWNVSPKIQELLSQMTLQEKIGQLNQRNICAYDEHVEEIKQEVHDEVVDIMGHAEETAPEEGTADSGDDPPADAGGGAQ